MRTRCRMRLWVYLTLATWMIEIGGQNRCFDERSLYVTPWIVNDVCKTATRIKHITRMWLEKFEWWSFWIVNVKSVLLQYGHIVDRWNSFDRISKSGIWIIAGCVRTFCCAFDWTRRNSWTAGQWVTVVGINHNELRIQKTTVSESWLQFIKHYHLTHHKVITVELRDNCYPTGERNLGSLGVQPESAHFRRRLIVGKLVDRVHIARKILAKGIRMRIQRSTGNDVDQQTVGHNQMKQIYKRWPWSDWFGKPIGKWHKFTIRWNNRTCAIHLNFVFFKYFDFEIFYSVWSRSRRYVCDARGYGSYHRLCCWLRCSECAAIKCYSKCRNDHHFACLYSPSVSQQRAMLISSDSSLCVCAIACICLFVSFDVLLVSYRIHRVRMCAFGRNARHKRNAWTDSWPVILCVVSLWLCVYVRRVYMFVLCCVLPFIYIENASREKTCECILYMLLWYDTHSTRKLVDWNAASRSLTSTRIYNATAHNFHTTWVFFNLFISCVE